MLVNKIQVIIQILLDSRIFILLAVLSLFFFLKNLYLYLRVKILFDQYQNYLLDDCRKFPGKEIEVFQLFKDAGVKDSSAPNVNPVGYGYIQTSNVSVMENMLVKREDIVSLVCGMFRKAKHVYYKRIYKSINPFYWLDIAVFFPRYFMRYFEISLNNSVVDKVLQSLYWIIGIICSLLAPEIRSLFVSFF